MSGKKQQVRSDFRKAVFKRDSFKCKTCGFPGSEEILDAHHVTDRTQMPNGGYVKENGISLCEPCHEKAEAFHSYGVAVPGFSPEELYLLIGSTYELAWEKSSKLK